MPSRMRTDVTDTNWAKTTCDKMVGTTKKGQTVPNVGLEQVHEAEIHGASGGYGDTAEAKYRIVTTMCVSGNKGGNGRSVVGILRLDTGSGGTCIALFGHRPVPLLRVRGDSGARPSGKCSLLLLLLVCF